MNRLQLGELPPLLSQVVSYDGALPQLRAIVLAIFTLYACAFEAISYGTWLIPN